jgi:two-component system chemotaxis response regulator CheB
MKKIRVLIIDDSALVRQLLTEILASDQSIEVVGTASDPYAAREKIKRLNPEVLTLDVEMPKMDGISFLRNLMRLRPMPVVMVSSLTQRGADATLKALELGAVDFVGKPTLDLANTLQDYADEIIAKVKMAAGVPVRALVERTRVQLKVEQKLSADAILRKHRKNKHFKTTDRIIAIGASTGGTEAIKEILMQMPADSPGVVIVQHIPAEFSLPFARRMDSVSQMTVLEAAERQQIIRGHVYIAPGDRHLMVEGGDAGYRCRLSDGPPVNRHRPAVDVLFRSVAQTAGQKAIGVLLSGMGADGAQGLMEMRDVGAATVAQDEDTSVVWGMPGEAVKLGAVDSVLPLQDIAAKINALAPASDRGTGTSAPQTRNQSGNPAPGSDATARRAIGDER